jgi:positive regulator of sigma E activity
MEDKMTKQGKVIATDGAMATLELDVVSKCTDCAKRAKPGVCEKCADYSESSSSRVVAYNKLGAEVGDTVEFGRALSENLIFTLLVFALPLVCAVMAYFISVLFIADNGIKTKIVSAVFIIATAFACAYAYKRSKTRCDYSIIKVVGNE